MVKDFVPYMVKDFVPYEAAIELKELGFDEPCFGYYKNGHFTFFVDMLNCNSNSVFRLYPTAPTYSQAFCCFREKHQLPSWVYTSNNQEYWYSVLKDGRMIVRDYKPFKSYEEAELACLRKLIEIVKQKQ